MTPRRGRGRDRVTREHLGQRRAEQEQGPRCPDCGTEWSPSCRRATPPRWDPTVGVRSNDPTRHPWSRRYRTGAA